MYDSSFYGKRELRKLREIGPDQLNMFKICFRNVKKKKNKINWFDPIVPILIKLKPVKFKKAHYIKAALFYDT